MAMLDAYIFFDGSCAEAMRFYERTLGGKIEMMMTYAQSPVKGESPMGSGDRIMHARLRIGDRALMASDGIPGESAKAPKGYSLSLTYPSAAEARRIFATLGEGGQVRMALQETFWAEAFGMLVDRFATPWMVNGGSKQLP
jgi:PhnB protein